MSKNTKTLTAKVVRRWLVRIGALVYDDAYDAYVDTDTGNVGPNSPAQPLTLDSLPPGVHYNVFCPKCGKKVGGCRCSGRGEPKTKVYELCEECLSSPRKVFEEALLVRQAKTDDVMDKIKKFFLDNPNPTDKQVHALANQLGVDEHKFEESIYKLLSSLLKGVGKHTDTPDSEFDAKELAMGIKVEKEHVDDPAIAKEVAKDHLAELPDYYSRLKKMEGEGKKASSNPRRAFEEALFW